MREIRFRAWYFDGVHKDKGDMQYDIPVAHSLAQCIDTDGIKRWTNCVEIMQYTGLHDKNGKKIYEGDIIKGIYGRYPQNWQVNELSARGVTFTRLTIPPISSPYFYRDMRHIDQWEVIGNIYENPELLKEAK